MKDIIKLTYGSDEAAKKSVDEECFELMIHHFRILPKTWDKLIEPYAFVTIRLITQPKILHYNDLFLDSMPLKDDVTATEKNEATFVESKTAVTEYQRTVKYRFDFFVRERLTEHSEFFESKIFDDPVCMEKSSSREKTVPVLEEVNNIEFGSAKNTWRKDHVAKQGLILDADDIVKPKTLHVRSSLLLNALRTIVKHSSHRPTGHEGDCFTSGMFPFPYKELYHHRKELLHFKKETSGARANHTS